MIVKVSGIIAERKEVIFSLSMSDTDQENLDMIHTRNALKKLEKGTKTV